MPATLWKARRSTNRCPEAFSACRETGSPTVETRHRAAQAIDLDASSSVAIRDTQPSEYIELLVHGTALHTNEQITTYKHHASESDAIDLEKRPVTCLLHCCYFIPQCTFRMAHDKPLLCDLFGRGMLPIGCIRPIQIRVHQDPTTCSRNYSPEAHTSSTSHDGMASNNDEIQYGELQMPRLQKSRG